MLWIITAIITSYLIGSIPTAYLFGRVLKGIDIRKHGSGNVGATNALRVLGKGPGIVVLLLDVLKGILPVVFLGDLLAARGILPEQISRILLGVAVICGHNWTIFLGFKGGKGVATTLGVLIGLALRTSGLGMVIGLLILTFALAFLFSKIVSLSSIITAILFPFYMVLLKQTILMFVVSMVIAAFIVLRHWPNIKRLLRGEERPLFFKKNVE